MKVDSKMTERRASGADDPTLPGDCQNFEHGAVSNDAVYVPHSKQSSRGQRGRGKSPGNYRHGNQPNGSADKLEYRGGARNRYVCIPRQFACCIWSPIPVLTRLNVE